MPVSSPENLSVVLAGGGSAGHVSPLLAIAHAIKRLRPDAAILAVGTADGLETRLVPESGFKLATISRVPMPRRPNMAAVRFPAAFRQAIREAGELLDRAEADVLVGVGGYVCTPMYLAAKRRGIPIVIHEANTKVGLANRWGARYTQRIGKAFAATTLKNAQLVGMPMRRQISSLDRAAYQLTARETLGLNPDAPTLVVTGGSLGALHINKALAEALPRLSAAGVQILHITGRGKAVQDASGAPLAAVGYQQVEYVDGMEHAYAAADLLLCRAGAGTVCELAAVGLPAVFVPLPVGNGEQARNAEPMVRAGAALLVPDVELTADWIISHVVELLQQPQKLADMAAAAYALGMRDADQKMAQMVLEAAQ